MALVTIKRKYFYSFFKSKSMLGDVKKTYAE